MGLILTCGALALLVALARGGTLGALTRRRLRSVGLLAASLAAQLAAAVVARPDGRGYAVALGVGGLLAAAFVARNVRVPGMALVGTGLVLNAVVVGLNGAMPVSVAAAQAAGLAEERLALAGDPRHEPLTAATRWGWLGDVVPVPSPVRREVVSPGDVAVALGLGWFVLASARRDEEPAWAPEQLAQG